MTDSAVPRRTAGFHTEPVRERGSARVDGVEGVVRRLAAVTTAGAILGVLIGGVGGRLAMHLLASLNPAADGVLSDDGFEIGRFTAAGTTFLLGSTLQFGLVGAVVYLALRNLAIGPPWVRIASLTAGGTVVVGAFLIHDGVDFTLLEPIWLAMALFIAIPLLFIPSAAVLIERWLRPTSWFMSTHRYKVAVVLLVWVIAGPFLLVVVPVVAAIFGVRRVTRSWPTWVGSATAWAARGVLGVIGVLASVDLVVDVITLA